MFARKLVNVKPPSNSIAGSLVRVLPSRLSRSAGRTIAQTRPAVIPPTRAATARWNRSIPARPAAPSVNPLARPCQTPASSKYTLHSQRLPGPQRPGASTVPWSSCTAFRVASCSSRHAFSAACHSALRADVLRRLLRGEADFGVGEDGAHLLTPAEDAAEATEAKPMWLGTPGTQWVQSAAAPRRASEKALPAEEAPKTLNLCVQRYVGQGAD